MGIKENGYLMLLKAGKHYLLLNGGDRLHLINVNDRLTEETEEQLLKVYPCEEAIIAKLGISYTTILKKNLRGVAVGGEDAGCELSLFIGKTKNKYELSEDTTQQVISDYFVGIKRMEANKRKLPKAPDQWRKQVQDAEVLQKMKTVRNALLVVEIICSGCFLFRVAPYKLWIILCILCSVVCILLAIKYPVYFTLLDLEDKKRKPKYGIGLGWLSTFSLLWLTYRTCFVNFIQWGRLLLYGVILTIAIAILLWILVKELRNCSVGFMAIVLALLFGAIGIVGQTNYLLDHSAEETEVYTVLDLDQQRGRRGYRAYICTILLENGKECRIKISAESYNSLSIGDSIAVVHREGGLGLEYVYLLEE